MIITRENLNEEVSNLNDEILNLEKKYGVNIIALAQVESLDTEESYSLYNNCSLKILAMSQARIENYIEQLGKISLKHHKENVELMKLVDKLIESIQSGKELSTELEGDMIELLKALKAERNDAGSKKNLYN